MDPAAFRPFDLGGIMAQNQQREYQQQVLDMRRQEMEDQQNRRAQLADLLPRAMGGEAKALQGLAGVDPEAYGRIQTQQRQATERSTEGLARIASVVRRQPYETRRAALQRLAPTLQQYGITPEQLQSFDPTDEQLDAYVALSGNQREQRPTSLQQNYEWLRQVNPQAAEQLIRRQTEPLPRIVTDPATGQQHILVPDTGGGDDDEWDYSPPPAQGGAGQPAPRTFPPGEW